MVDVDELLPWHDRVWEMLRARREWLPHALLLTGADGLGKNVLAEQMAQYLLCEAPTEHACGNCRSCQLFAAGTHPDLHVVQPEAVFKGGGTRLAEYAQRYPPREKGKDSKDSVEIRIDQIRALIEGSQTRPQISRRKMLILSPADTLNVNAANSLLKLLEEPPPDSQLLLVTSRPARLTATVRSRCARLTLAAPSRPASIEWLVARGQDPAQAGLLLDLAGQSPLGAIALGAGGFLEHRAAWLEDLETLAAGRQQPLACAQRWKTTGGERALGWLQTLVADLLRARFGAAPERLHNRDLAVRLQALAKGLHLNRLFEFLETINVSRSLFGPPLDELLLLEDVLIRWSRIRRKVTDS